MIFNIIISVIAYIFGAQLYLPDLKAISGRYNFKNGTYQYYSLIICITAITVILFDSTIWNNFIQVIKCTSIVFCAYIALEWILAKLNIKKQYIVLAIRLCFIILFSILISPFTITASILIGVYFKNCPFGVVMPDVFNFKKSRHATRNLDIQNMIEEAASQGGGTIRIPKGKYIIDSFIQINHSNITIEGETDEKGNLLTELICKSPTVRGDKNPWISPFFITTGEIIQPSNIFWGVDFRKKKHTFLESSSLSDPGSDGTILSPESKTKIIKKASKGETTLHVEDSSKIGKYILLALFNTTKEGNLIQDILGVKKLRPEWTVANRAGEEEAPSYQWLAEVKQHIDKHTILLSTPLIRDVDMQYEPEIYDVEMLENIHIRNLKLNTCWNGLFHHHGFPLYYSVRQAQEMDYGWNGINMKRVAHGSITNVVFDNFTNPLYIMDSREIDCNHISIMGYDGHQGIKLYCHACNNHIHDIVFHNHFADMMGGEGNVYNNIFEDIYYRNPHFCPVDFDFHGFSEGPFSPPSDNIFKNISGFRFIKGAGAISHIPSCAQNNEWYDIKWQGNKKGDNDRFYMMPYRKRNALYSIISAVGFSLVKMKKTKTYSFLFFCKTFKEKIKDTQKNYYNRNEHQIFFPNNRIYN